MIDKSNEPTNVQINVAMTALRAENLGEVSAADRGLTP